MHPKKTFGDLSRRFPKMLNHRLDSSLRADYLLKILRHNILRQAQTRTRKLERDLVILNLRVPSIHQVELTIMLPCAI